MRSVLFPGGMGRDAGIEDPYLLGLQVDTDIGGFDVFMNKIAMMQIGQGSGYMDGKRQELRHRHGGCAELVQGLTFGIRFESCGNASCYHT